jgi:hypothetical protein
MHFFFFFSFFFYFIKKRSKKKKMNKGEPASPLPPVPHIDLGLYRHYSGQEYRVLGVARNSERPSDFDVVYQAQYGDRELWHRPYDMFVGTVQQPNGTTGPRFRFQSR